ncbi:fungal-specific transcription factor domain-containing protein [Daldinia caldariorum]|uniref:fungal-specific transcription factor domain-containing protein n=1 Tax=Daldinia caldariorum TaxID=326644 RepID=UPI002007441F|nr:fungal-specific transcription factor domain-containing protein [Daldinia caldariorum]KAI1463061.1 fungal-specific transcription factor domain-containing protein [Daldinia caldariorum]
MSPPTLASRSTQGCWTCRLRKKKCDETHPSCLRCTSLQIPCDGYGPRPYWMDRGELQKERARYKTQIVAQIKSAMRKNKTPNTSQNPGLPPAHLTQEPTWQSGLGHASEREVQPFGGDGLIRNEALGSADFSAELLDEILSSSIYGRSSSDAFRTTSASTSPATEGSNVQSYGDVSRPDSQPEANVETINSLCDPILSEYCSSESSGSSSIADWPLSAQTNPSSALTRLVSLPGQSDPILRGDVEDILFMYYLDHVFHIYCPFYLLSHRQARGWLFSILKRVKSAYHAALGLSEMHLATSTQHSSSPVTIRAGGHYELALQELQVSLARSSAWGGNLGLAHNVEVLTTILHLLFYEASHGGRYNWQMHLGGATALLPLLVQTQMGSIAARNDRIHEQQDVINSPPDTSVSFLLGFFVHMNIIACASTRSTQFLEPDPKLLLETGEINLEDLTGCSNWAMVLIFEISCLERWKREEETAHRLSLIELTKRGRRIEERLLNRLASIESDPSQGAPVKGYLRPDSVKTEITRIFALSAMTYLHVVISGPYPEIPDIKKSVSKTMEAFQNLSDPKLLQYVVWPYCISGCLASDRGQKVFRDLVSVPHITHGTCLEALKIMEECWRLRETESSSCDWVHIMEKRGQYILLI